MFDLPPILSGSSADKLTALRNYLVRLAQELNQVENQALVQSAHVSADGKRNFSGGSGAEGDIEAVQKNAAALRQLIIKTGDRLSDDIEASQQDSMHYADGQIDALSQTYLAKSEFGSFTENIERQITSTAKGVVESYDYESRILSNQESLELLQYYVRNMDGQIRRGIVTDPETGLEVTGIAISQNLQFTGGVVHGEDGADYYQLASGQTFGLYTSTGWQFWIDGHRKGWYDSSDGMLHISNVAVESSLQLGSGWRLEDVNGLGIKYTGA